MNPRVAKLSYLEQNHDKYDSYIIGPSGTSSYPTEQLNEYFGGSFYNLTMYGADMKDVELTSQYLIENYTVKNLVVSLYIHDAEVYDVEPDSMTYNLHYKVDGSSALGFYTKYLLADPRVSLNKLESYLSDPYLQQSYRVFDAETGAYDKSRRDVEAIGDLTSYLAQDRYAVFNDYPESSTSIPYLSECMESVARIKELCEEAGVTLTVVCPPMYSEQLASYSQEDQAAFRNALAQVTDYWDFTLSSISYDPRYFYDETHFRNAVGKMALARMFEDDSVYYPQDLGEHILQGETPGAPQAEAQEESSYTASVPILMYHSVEEVGEGSESVSVSRLEEHFQALQEAGYQAVTFEDLLSYVTEGTPLPEKPVVITFDDGYENNYLRAYPLLQKYQMKATIFAIGVSVGKDTYKDTGVAMTPHFTMEEAQTMMDSGLVSVQSHGYNLHEVSGRDEEPIRTGALQKEDESEEDYIAFLRQDYQSMEEVLGYAPSVLAYPYGYSSELSEVVLSELGIYATVTIQEKTNTIIQGLPQSLRQMGRYYMKEELTGEDLIALLES
jgi:peptidoglycan/xylan/chitin deacetylase (PgdA/CDA1 family)